MAANPSEIKGLVSEEKLRLLRVPGPYSKVYRDECVFSFANPYGKDGLYVNLRTYMAVSKPFLALDQKRSGFPLYLHQRWTQYVKEAAKPGQKVTKLAVGVEGGFQLDRVATKKELSVSVVSPEGSEVKRFPYNAETKGSFPGDIAKVVSAVLAQLDGTEPVKDAFSLEEERKESKFARDLPQLDNGKKISMDPKEWKCEDSGLASNLWLNLSTGYIGSGRKETGGTEAAIRHFESTGRKYPLVVKLGTITPDGADVYCYATDRMVLDPLLDKHLKHWGLDRSKMYKTDKDMTQLTVERQSKAFEESAITGGSEKEPPVKGAGLQGLTNFGNTCYINSTFQLLFSTQPFCDRYAKSAESVFKRAPGNPAADLTTQLCKLSLALTTTAYQTPNPEVKRLAEEAKLPDLTDPAIQIRPKMLKKAIAKDHHEFNSKRQQDAQEYILHVLKAISRDARSFPNAPGAADLSRIFEFDIEERTEDAQSKRVKYKVQKGITFLPLPIPNPAASGGAPPPKKRARTGGDAKVPPTDDGKDAKQRVEAASSSAEQEASDAAVAELTQTVKLDLCLQEYLKPSVLDGYTSPVTKQKGIAYRTTRMRSFPEYLFIQLYRFEQVDLRSKGKGYQIRKVRRQVPMPAELDMKALASTGLRQGEQELPKSGPKPLDVDANIVAAVTGMGFSKNAAIRAALATKNAGSEQAVNWVVQHMGDPDINDPVPQEGGDDDDDAAGVDAGAIANCTAMGFSKKHAIKALKATNGDVQRAVDWLFSHPEGADEPQEAKQKKIKPGPNTDKSVYELVGFISHIGNNATSGHYVCHAKKAGKWVLFNDAKVTACAKPPFGMGYIYLYKRK